MIHCDAGPNVVRSYPVKKNGAGYTAEIVNILKGEKDQWFRPADVCVAPDGSLIIADWYDPGVGGHAAGDQIRGRIYRVAPAGFKIYNSKTRLYYCCRRHYCFAKSKSCCSLSCIHSTCSKWVPRRFLNLKNSGNTSADPRMRARAFWALVKMPIANARQYIQRSY